MVTIPLKNVRSAIPSLQAVSKTGRVPRRPSFPFQIRTRPWQIQPFVLAPVLPGETLKNLLLQSRVVTDPIKSPLLGWHTEYYFFYVKLRDLDGRDDFTEMFIDQDKDLSSYESASTTWTNHYGGLDWVKMCTTRVVDEYFRDEGEAWDDHLLDSVPLAQVGDIRWLDSVINSADYVALDSGDLADAGSQDGAEIHASEIETALRAWEMARMMGMTNATYEDYLATYGIKTSQEELHRPELIRYMKNWTYPTNTIDPSDGSPTSACSWVIQERADKDRFFREPGFIIGLNVTRPKVYFRMDGNAASLMNSMFSWLPAIMNDDPMSSLVAVADGAGEGPLGDVTDANGYIVDIKDLLLYGDQFHNFANTATDAGFIDLPTAAILKRYADTDDADALFVSESPANQIRQDGIVSMSILGTQQDTTPVLHGTQ